jgi:membrane protease YdiL (CAAX protease family)
MILADLTLSAPALGVLNMLLFVGTPACLLYLWVRGFPKPTRPVPRDEFISTFFGLILLIFSIWMFAAIAATALLRHLSPDVRLTTANLIAVIVAIYVALVLISQFRPHGIERLGLAPHQFKPGVMRGLGALLLILPWVLWTNLGVEAALKYFHRTSQTEHEIFKMWSGEGGHSTAFKITAIITAVLIAPIFEEILFRGLIQTLFLRMFQGRPVPPVQSQTDPEPMLVDQPIPQPSPVLAYETPAVPQPHTAFWRHYLAILITAALFAIVHQPWTIQPSIFVLALGLGLAYERTGNLWTSITIHALFNTFNIFLFLQSTAT